MAVFTWWHPHASVSICRDCVLLKIPLIKKVTWGFREKLTLIPIDIRIYRNCSQKWPPYFQSPTALEPTCSNYLTNLEDCFFLEKRNSNESSCMINYHGKGLCGHIICNNSILNRMLLSVFNDISVSGYHSNLVHKWQNRWQQWKRQVMYKTKQSKNCSGLNSSGDLLFW